MVVPSAPTELPCYVGLFVCALTKLELRTQSWYKALCYMLASYALLIIFVDLHLNRNSTRS